MGKNQKIFLTVHSMKALFMESLEDIDVWKNIIKVSRKLEWEKTFREYFHDFLYFCKKYLITMYLNWNWRHFESENILKI